MAQSAYRPLYLLPFAEGQLTLVFEEWAGYNRGEGA